jgi:hypothetical protein
MSASMQWYACSSGRAVLPTGCPCATCTISHNLHFKLPSVHLLGEQGAIEAALLQSVEERNGAAARLRRTDAGDLLELRLALREADGGPGIGQEGVAVVRALLLLLGDADRDTPPHQVQMPRLVGRLLSAELAMETESGTEGAKAHLSWMAAEVLDAAGGLLSEGATIAP